MPQDHPNSVFPAFKSYLINRHKKGLKAKDFPVFHRRSKKCVFSSPLFIFFQSHSPSVSDHRYTRISDPKN